MLAIPIIVHMCDCNNLQPFGLELLWCWTVGLQAFHLSCLSTMSADP